MSVDLTEMNVDLTEMIVDLTEMIGDLTETIVDLTKMTDDLCEMNAAGGVTWHPHHLMIIGAGVIDWTIVERTAGAAMVQEMHRGMNHAGVTGAAMVRRCHTAMKGADPTTGVLLMTGVPLMTDVDLMTGVDLLMRSSGGVDLQIPGVSQEARLNHEAWHRAMMGKTHGADRMHDRKKTLAAMTLPKTKVKRRIAMDGRQSDTSGHSPI